jgi:hypothetical protein
MNDETIDTRPQQIDMTFDAGLDDLGQWATQVHEGQLYGVTVAEVYTTSDGERRIRIVLRGPVGR